MRRRERILGNLEDLYRGAFARAEKNGEEEAMARLDFQFQRDQLQLEVLLDIRDLLALSEPDTGSEEKSTSLLEKAQAIRRLTRLR